MSQEQLSQEEMIENMEEDLENDKSNTYYFYAQQGCTEAMFRLGMRNDIFVRDPTIKPLDWLQRAAEHGHAEAWCALGWRYSTHTCYGGLKNDEKAIMCYEKAADMGIAAAYYELAVYYNEGRQVELDEKKAFEYFLKAAELGSPDALISLSTIYKNGNSVVEKDFEKAFDYAQKAYAELRKEF